MDRVQEIKELLVKRKDPMFKQFMENLETGVTIQPVPLDILEKEEEAEIKLTTGTLIDEIIGGGVPQGKSMLLYGEFGSGKSQACFTIAVLCPNKIIYIDTEGSFRISRIKEICKSRGIDWEKIKKKIIYYRPKNWAEQMLILFGLPSPADAEGKIDLIVCDSLSKHFRGIEFLGRENLGIKNGLIREFILTLEQLAEMHKAAFIYTTQIYDKVGNLPPKAGPAQTQSAVGGRSVEHQPDIVLHFRKGSGNVRVARMIDSSWNKLAERSFVINERGIDVIPEKSVVYPTEEKRAEKFAKTQEQESRRGGKKKAGEEDKSEDDAGRVEEIQNGED